jgi:hypothetical protein
VIFLILAIWFTEIVWMRKHFTWIMMLLHTSTNIVRSFALLVYHLPLPWQHSLVHYLINIQYLGAPNGLCSSITECHHKSAVKQPWHQSSQYEALGQMLLTNQSLNKLAASWADFIDHRMLPPDQPPPHQNEGEAEDEESGPVGRE